MDQWRQCGREDVREHVNVSTKGRLLVATPPLGDPNFDRSVVYMLEHTDDGAVGVVLNRPGPETVIEGLEAWMDRLSPPAVVFGGGPVELDALIALASADEVDEDSWSELREGWARSTCRSIRTRWRPRCAGCASSGARDAGWAPAQLESESKTNLNQ